MMARFAWLAAIAYIAAPVALGALDAARWNCTPRDVFTYACALFGYVAVGAALFSMMRPTERRADIMFSGALLAAGFAILGGFLLCAHS